MALEKIPAAGLEAGSVNATAIAVNSIPSSRLTTTGVVANSYGNSSQIPVVTIDSAGRITNASTTAVAGVTGFSYEGANNTFSITTGDGSTFKANISANSIAALALGSSGVVANVYGNATAIPVITIDEDGRISNATTTSVSGVTGVSYTAANSTLTVSTSISNYTAPLTAGNSSVQGLLKVVDSVANGSTDAAASANSVKTAYELAGNAVSNATSYAATAYSNAVSTAALDATSKANTAYSNAVSIAASDATSKANTAYSNAVSVAASDATTKAGTAYSNAVSTAALDATSKSDTAYSNAVSVAASDATSKANTAYSNAVGQATSLAGSAYSNAVSQATTLASTAYSNAVANASSDATSKAATAYSNAVGQATTLAGTAYSNATSYADTKSGTAYTNAVSQATTLAGNAYSNATSYADTKAGTAYSNATTFASNADNISSGTLSGARIQANNGVIGNTSGVFVRAGTGVTVNATGVHTNQDISNTANVTFGYMTITGNLVVQGTTTTVNTVNLSVQDNMIYLNSNNTVANPDLGFAGNYNDGTYHHAGFFRDATDARWKVFDNYLPEPDATAYIDTSNTSFQLANFQANVVYANLTGNVTGNVSGSANSSTYVGGNTAGDLRSYSDTVAGTAYSNAVAYAASNTYVNNTFLPLAGGTMTGSVANATFTTQLTVGGRTRVYASGIADLSSTGNDIGLAFGGGGFFPTDGALNLTNNTKALGNSSYTFSNLWLGTGAYAPVFTDANNTDYYLNPYNPSGWAMKTRGEIRLENNAGETTHFNYSNGGSTNYIRGTTYFDTGPTYITSSLYTNVLYDSDSTSYYINPGAPTSAVFAGSMGLGATSPVNSAWGNSTTTSQMTIYGSDYGVLNLKGDYGTDAHYSMGVGDNRFYAAYDNVSGVHRLTYWGSFTGFNNITNPSYNIHLAGTGYASDDWRAPIFYDSNNTGYYVDPASGSNLYGTLVNTGGTAMTSGWNRSMMLSASYPVLVWNSASTSYSGIGVDHSSAASRFYFWINGTSSDLTGTGTIAMSMHSGNYVTATGSFRAPIFYDSDDSGWYVNPASTSRFNYGRFQGPAYAGGSCVYGDERMTLSVGSAGLGSIVYQSTYNDPSYPDYGMVFVHGASGGNRNVWSISPDGPAKGNLLGFLYELNATNIHTETYRFWLDGGGISYSQTSSRAPIFYDRNNSSYYVDPNSSSVLSTLGLGGATPDIALSVSGAAQVSGYTYLGGSAGSAGSWSARMYSSGGATYLNTSSFRVDRTGYGGDSYYFYMDTTGNSFASASLRAPIFYDSVDPSYYGDFASTSNFNITNTNVAALGNSFASRVMSGPYFGNGESGKAVDIIFTTASHWGYVDITVTSSYSYQNSPGKLTRRYTTGLYSNNVYSGQSRTVDAIGQIVNNVALGPISAIGGGQYKVTLYHIASTGNGFQIKIDAFDYADNSLALVRDATISSIYNNSSGYYDNIPSYHDGLSVTGTLASQYITASQSIVSSTRVDAPTFYDSGNTSYYLDPADTSILNAVDLRSPTAIALSGGGNTGTYNRTLFYTNYNNSSESNYNGIFIERGRLSDSGSAEVRNFIIGSRGGEIQWKVDGTGITTSTASSRAPIFYDTDTAYYGDFASNSNLNTVNANRFSAAVNNLITIGDDSATYTINDSAGRSRFYVTSNYPSITLNAQIAGSNANHGATLQFTHNGYDSNRQWVIGTGGSGQQLDFGTGQPSNKNPHEGISGYSGTTCMRMITSGYVGIGGSWGYYGTVANPSYPLHVQGIAYASGDMRAPVFYDTNTSYYLDLAGNSNASTVLTGAWYFRSDRDTTSSDPPLQAYSSGGSGAIMGFHRGGYFATNMGLDSDNVFRIGGWSASTNRFQMDMSGNLTMAGNITAYSDIRLKENVEQITNAIDTIKQIRGVTFTRNDQDDKTKRHAGVIAQEVEAVFPEVVSEDNDGVKNVAYGNMVGLLVEAIKEQQSTIERLEALVNSLINK